MWESKLIEVFIREWLAGHFLSCVVLVQLVAIWRLWIRNVYVTEALRREQESTIGKLEGLQTRLLELFLREPKPSLRELASDTESEFELKR